MKKIGYLCIVASFLTVMASRAQAQINIGDKGTLSGKVYADYYWFAQNHNADVEGDNGFWFRRIYLTYERALAESFSTRLRLEMNSSGILGSNDKMTPVVKDAYLKWKKGSHQILAGISSTPTFGLTEDVWGYRSVEKAPQDLFEFGSSRDFGLSFKGKLGKEDRLGYHFFVGNGNSNRVELNQGKKLMLAVNYRLTDHFVVEAYGDWNDGPNSEDVVTVQGFAGYQSDRLDIGALYSHQVQHSASPVGADLNLDLISLFGSLAFSENLKGFLRADHLFDPNPAGPSTDYLPMSSSAESSTVLIGGLDVLLAEKIHLIPNIESVVYGETPAGVRPATDLLPRLTLFYQF